jgi:histone H3/H4
MSHSEEKKVPKKRGKGVEEDIRKQQRSTEVYVKVTPIRDYIHHQFKKDGEPRHVAGPALLALTEGIQTFIETLCYSTYLIALRAKRKTTRPRDLRVAVQGIAPSLVLVAANPRPSPEERGAERERRNSLSREEREEEAQIERFHRRNEQEENDSESESELESGESEEEYLP